MLIDEADFIIDNYKLIIKENMKSASELGGMVVMAKASRVVLLSATFEPHHK